MEENSSLEALFRRCSKPVFRLCTRYSQSREEAEDLTQEVLLKAHEKIAEFKESSSLETWVYRIAVNHCLGHLRNMQRRNELNLEYIDSIVVGNLSPEGDRILARIDLERILSKTNPRTRKILFLCLAEGLSYKEAGEVMNMEKSAVAKTVLRFRAEFTRHPAKGVGVFLRKAIADAFSGISR